MPARYHAATSEGAWPAHDARRSSRSRCAMCSPAAADSRYPPAWWHADTVLQTFHEKLMRLGFENVVGEAFLARSQVRILPLAEFLAWRQ